MHKILGTVACQGAHGCRSQLLHCGQGPRRDASSWQAGISINLNPNMCDGKVGGDLYEPTHGGKVLGMAPGLPQLEIIPFR